MSTYKVKSGDGWYKISKTTGVPLDLLLKLNGATTSTMLHPNQELKIKEDTPQPLEEPGLLLQWKNTINGWFTPEPAAEPVLNLNRGKQRNKVIQTNKAVVNGEVVDECARFGNCRMRDEGYISNGDAWTRHNNLQTVYSGFNTKERPKTFNLDQVVNYNLNAADNVANNFDINGLDKDSMYSVGMYYMGSPSLEKAYNEGADGATNTHTGNLMFDKDLNDWVVKHNIHGKETINRYSDVLGSKGKYGITGIYKPHKNDAIGSALSFVRGLFKEGGTIRQYEKGGDVEGPRYSTLGSVWNTAKDWVTSPVQHFKSATASDDYVPTLKDGHSHKNAIVVRKSNHNLYYYDKDGNLAFQSQVATGANSGPKQKAGDSRTPTGRFSISSYETKRDPKVFGHNRFLRLNTGKWTGFGIHGDANRPELIGTDASHGCVRMPNDLLVKFTDMIGSNFRNIPVYILDENDLYKNGGKLLKNNRL